MKYTPFLDEIHVLAAQAGGQANVFWFFASLSLFFLRYAWLPSSFKTRLLSYSKWSLVNMGQVSKSIFSYLRCKSEKGKRKNKQIKTLIYHNHNSQPLINFLIRGLE